MNYSIVGHPEMDRLASSEGTVLTFLTPRSKGRGFYLDILEADKMSGQRIGYKRVSTLDQNTARPYSAARINRLVADPAPAITCGMSGRIEGRDGHDGTSKSGQGMIKLKGSPDIGQ
jgi:hypothetical protein